MERVDDCTLMQTAFYMEGRRESLMKSDPVMYDILVAGVLIAAADEIAQEMHDKHSLIKVERALKTLAMEYPGLMHREALCGTIEDFLYKFNDN